MELTPHILVAVNATARKGQGYVRFQLFQRNQDGTVSTHGPQFALPAWAVGDVGRLMQMAAEKAEALPGVVTEG